MNPINMSLDTLTVPHIDLGAFTSLILIATFIHFIYKPHEDVPIQIYVDTEIRFVTR